jgi:hypothetical protein
MERSCESSWWGPLGEFAEGYHAEESPQNKLVIPWRPG